MNIRDYAIIGVVAAAAVLHSGWRLAIWYGFVPCSHACYWCGKHQPEPDRANRLAGYVWSLSGKPCMFASMKHNDEWRAVYFEDDK
jgi:hypothetical protein